MTPEKIDITLLVSKLRTERIREGRGAAYGETRIRSQRCSRRLLRGYRYGEGSFRKLIASSTEILKDSYEQTSNAKELYAQAEQKIFAIVGWSLLPECSQHQRRTSRSNGPNGGSTS